jgi:hypothetical protein
MRSNLTGRMGDNRKGAAPYFLAWDLGAAPW